MLVGQVESYIQLVPELLPLILKPTVTLTLSNSSYLLVQDSSHGMVLLSTRGGSSRHTNDCRYDDSLWDVVPVINDIHRLGL